MLGNKELQDLNTQKRELKERLAQEKWHRLETAILNDEELHPILNFIDTKAPENWHSIYDTCNMRVLNANAQGYCPISFNYFYDKLKEEWTRCKVIKTSCLVCGEFNNHSLSIILGWSWDHYCHL